MSIFTRHRRRSLPAEKRGFRLRFLNLRAYEALVVR